MKKLRPGEMVQIKTVEELLGVVNEESAMDIEIYKIRSFQGHPFKVVDDDKMLELVDSIKANGILSPVLLRPCGNDLYEMVSGHRRLHATKLAGLTAIPSMQAKVLFSVFLDRMGISMRNGWFDEKNRVFIIYQISEIQEDLGFSKRKAMDYLAELEKFGLIEKRKEVLVCQMFCISRTS